MFQGPRVLGLGTPLDRFSRYYENHDFRRHTSSDPEIRPSQLFFQLLVFAINLPPVVIFICKKYDPVFWKLWTGWPI